MTEPSHATSARTIVSSATHGSLGTMAADHPGYPFVSMVPFAVDDGGNVILALSDLAEHAANIAADDHASFMALEDAAGKDPNAAGRVTLLGRCTALEGDHRTSARDRFLATHPGAFFVDFADFKLYRLVVEQVRYVGGFGRMSWVSADTYREGASV